jgi:hypothetical protein
LPFANQRTPYLAKPQAQPPAGSNCCVGGANSQIRTTGFSILTGLIVAAVTGDSFIRARRQVAIACQRRSAWRRRPLAISVRPY